MTTYQKEHIDHIFYRMRESQPKSANFYVFIIILKIVPMFIQLNSLGYTELNDGTSSIHSYFKYFSVCFYIQNSLDINNMIVISFCFLGLNLILVSLLFYYLSISKKIKKIDENYGSQNSLNCFFTFFSVFSFFKYILLNQFFQEINFMPLICTNSIDINKINSNSIFVNKFVDNFLNNLCTGSNLYQFLVISALNFLIDIIMNSVLMSRFFDFNILSDFFWNSSPNIIYSTLYFESFFQVFFILFLNYNNKTYRIWLGYFYYFLIFTYILKFFLKKHFYTIKSKKVFLFIEYIKIMCFIGYLITTIFYFFLNQFPSDFILISLIGIEIFLTYVIFTFNHKKDEEYIASIIASTNLNSINNSNVMFIICYLITEFKVFSDINLKFDDEKLDLFLSNYVIHLKNCEDKNCPCKNMTKKVKEGTNITRSNINLNTNNNIGNNNNISGTAIINSNNEISSSEIPGSRINFYHSSNISKKSIKDDYIINRFFNNISSNISSSIKNTNNNINMNNIKDSDKQKVVYNLRVRLINAVKKLISFRLENYYKNLENSYSTNLNKYLKHFVRINYFALNLLLNKSYYKTIFLYHEYLSNYFKKNKAKYKSNLILYFYLKKCGIKDYNNFVNLLKSTKKENSNINLDFRLVLGSCTKFYDIEKKIIKTIRFFSEFIAYFERETVYFDMLLKNVKKFRNSYKSLTGYIRYFFKNDKLSNLYITSKIILFFKIMQFDIPDGLHNKLVIQNYETDESQVQNRYVDTNYFLIANYLNGEFIINFVSHELLILLEYSESDLKNEDLHILIPEKLREVHKNLIINQIKNKNIHNVQYKEIFLVSKKRNAILFDLHFKIMLNLKGEITVLCVYNLKIPKKEFRTGFICVDSQGEILAINKEFEDFMILSMKVLDYIKLDTDKIIFQGLTSKIETFFKEEDNINSEFYDRFDYETYLNSLFSEEFESLKDKNDSLYLKKYNKFNKLKDIVRKSRHNKFFDLYIKYRIIGEAKLYFMKFYIKININGKTMETYNPTTSLINSVKISKREMAKLNTIKKEDTIEDQNIEEQNLSASRDFLNESQSILSSAAMILKSTNKKRLFRQNMKGFKFLPKSTNIILLSFFLGFFTVCSLILNIIFISIINNLLGVSKDKYLLLSLGISLKTHIMHASSGILNLALIQNELFPFKYQDFLINYNLSTFQENSEKLLKNEINKIVDINYRINYLDNLYFDQKINNKIEEVNNNFIFLFDNGLIYKKNDESIKTFKEISTIQNKINHVLDNFEAYSNLTNFMKVNRENLNNTKLKFYNSGNLYYNFF